MRGDLSQGRSWPLQVATRDIAGCPNILAPIPLLASPLKGEEQIATGVKWINRKLLLKNRKLPFFKRISL